MGRSHSSGIEKRKRLYISYENSIESVGNEHREIMCSTFFMSQTH